MLHKPQPRALQAQPHNDQITHLPCINVGVEAQAVCQFLHRRIAQDFVPVTNHHRHFLRFHMKPVKQFLRSFVRIEIHVSKRVCITRQKLAIRKVFAQCRDPINMTFPCPLLMRARRRKINARMKISLSSASLAIIVRSASALISEIRQPR